MIRPRAAGTLHEEHTGSASGDGAAMAGVGGQVLSRGSLRRIRVVAPTWFCIGTPSARLRHRDRSGLWT